MKTRSLLLLPAAALALNAASAVQVHAAAVDYFLKIDGIAGESLDSKHAGEFQLLSFSWGATNAARSTGGGGGAGKATHNPLTVTTALSRATSKLFLACANGQHIKSASVEVVTHSADGVPNTALKIDLGEVLISSFTEGGNSGGTPVDSLSLNFSRITVTSPTDLKLAGVEVVVPDPTDLAGN